MFTTFPRKTLFRTNPRALAFTAVGLALLLAGGASQGLRAAAESGPEQVYEPIQAISYELGSKRAIGHFARTNNACEVILMVAEIVDPEVATPTTAARLRVTLQPGQAAGLDSENGRSIDLTCGPNGKTLSVREGSWIAATL